MKYSINDIAHAKGTSEPVRQALLAQADEIERLKAELKVEQEEAISLESDIHWHEQEEDRLNRRIAELEQALRRAVSSLVSAKHLINANRTAVSQTVSSDKIFAQTLTDYQDAIDQARKALEGKP